LHGRFRVLKESVSKLRVSCCR